MKKPRQNRISNRRFQPNRLATTAVSLTLLSAAQTQLQAQNQQPKPQPAPAAARQVAEATDEEALKKYFNFGYNYCDAKVLAAFWGEDPNDTDIGAIKISMGHKLLSPDIEAEWVMRDARSEALQKTFPDMACDYTDGGYTYKDAEKLGKYWGNGTWESKVAITELLIMGHDKVVQAAQKTAKASE